MKTLSECFEHVAYGVHVRLVVEEDAPFILKLRTDEKLSRFLHSTDADIEKQVAWIRSYKERERQGLDYYFIYSVNGVPFGVNRIYDITEKQGTAGSWICRPGTDVEHSVASLLILRDILFETLELEFDVFDVRKGNKHVQRMHKMMGARQVGETELDYLYRLSKADYLLARKNVIELLNLNT